MSKEPTGRIRLWREDEALPELGPELESALDPGARAELAGLRDLLRRVRALDQITVTMRKVRYVIQLFGADASEESGFAELPGFHVSASAWTGEQELPFSDRLQRPLDRYLSVLATEGEGLAAILDEVNAVTPLALQYADVLSDNVFVTGDEQQRLEWRINLCTTCNQRCLFCCARGGTQPVELSVLERAVALLARRSASHPEQVVLTLTGGEPTGHPHLVDVVSVARAAGFERVFLQTNGVRLDRAERVEALHRAGVTGIMLSLHSHREPVYDEIVGTRGQFPRVMRALEHLARHPFELVKINQVICRPNVGDLADYLRFLSSLPLHPRTDRRFIPSIANLGQDNGHWAEVALPHEEVVAALHEAVGRHPGLFGTLSGDCSVPTCLFWHHRALRPLAPSFRVAGETVYLTDHECADPPNHKRIKHQRCRDCAFDTRCGGLSTEYARTFGLEALRPVKGSNI